MMCICPDSNHACSGSNTLRWTAWVTQGEAQHITRSRISTASSWGSTTAGHRARALKLCTPTSTCPSPYSRSIARILRSPTRPGPPQNILFTMENDGRFCGTVAEKANECLRPIVSAVAETRAIKRAKHVVVYCTTRSWGQCPLPIS